MSDDTPSGPRSRVPPTHAPISPRLTGASDLSTRSGPTTDPRGSTGDRSAPEPTLVTGAAAPADAAPTTAGEPCVAPLTAKPPRFTGGPDLPEAAVETDAEGVLPVRERTA